VFFILLNLFYIFFKFFFYCLVKSDLGNEISCFILFLPIFAPYFMLL